MCGFTLGFILLTPISVKISKIQKEESIEKIKSHENDVRKYPKFQQELQELLQKKKTLSLDIEKLEKMNMIHSGYLPYAQTVLTYLETGRADTLKEALNLLEYELREDERDRIQQVHNQEMQRHAAAQSAALQDIQVESGRAADAAEEAALWGAAATFIAASEAERQRKRDRDQSL